MSETPQAQRYRLSLRLPHGFRSERLGSNWSDMFMGLPRDTEWEVEVGSDDELGWLIADFLALHADVICEAAGVEEFVQVRHPEEFVEIALL
jgi:hypothetical protein